MIGMHQTIRENLEACSTEISRVYVRGTFDVLLLHHINIIETQNEAKCTAMS